jgi:hypothetical protein
VDVPISFQCAETGTCTRAVSSRLTPGPQTASSLPKSDTRRRPCCRTASIALSTSSRCFPTSSVRFSAFVVQHSPAFRSRRVCGQRRPLQAGGQVCKGDGLQQRRHALQRLAVGALEPGLQCFECVGSIISLYSPANTWQTPQITYFSGNVQLYSLVVAIWRCLRKTPTSTADRQTARNQAPRWRRLPLRPRPGPRGLRWPLPASSPTPTPVRAGSCECSPHP